MTSGIYELTFPSGLTYIGKSVNIENRWKQHRDKLLKGTAASNMQTEYNICGLFVGSVLWEGHSDHIDIMEAMFINRLKPQLNGTYPEDPLAGLDADEVLKVVELLNMSTLQHVNKIYEFDAGQTTANAIEAKLREEMAELSAKRTEETIKADLNNLLEEKDSEIYGLEAANAVLKRALTEANRMIAYHNLPWYKKIFN